MKLRTIATAAVAGGCVIATVMLPTIANADDRERRRDRNVGLRGDLDARADHDVGANTRTCSP